MKERLDLLMVSLSLVRSRSEAADLIRRGKVEVNGKPADKPARECSRTDDIRILEKQYVGRGAHKLAHALKEFGVQVHGKVAMDIGASTGGFTEVLLQEGARHVYAIDSGSGQLASKLFSDSRVTSLERTDIRMLNPKRITERAEIIVIDVSFISLTHVIPTLRQFMDRKAEVIALIKPQFEVGQDLIGKNGIVHDAAAREGAIRKIREAAAKCGLREKGMIESPLAGGSGNVEYLIHLTPEA